jgi:NADPH:quinone reductase-like Zn-dependent oxidoreductase
MPSYWRLNVHELSADFRRATRLVEVSDLPKAAADTVVVKNHYVGINATDVNITSGMYTGDLPPPFGSGLDAVGVVTEVGVNVLDVKVGDAVAYRSKSIALDTLCHGHLHLLTKPP